MKIIKYLSCLITTLTLSAVLIFDNAEALTNHINVEIYVDQGIVSKSGSVVTNVNGYVGGVYGFYSSKFGINVDFNFVANGEHILASTADSCLGATNYTGVCSHEIGHLYGVTDHYNTIYGDDRDNCMWGANYSNESVINNMLICNTCKNTITNNKSRYNHS